MLLLAFAASYGVYHDDRGQRVSLAEAIRRYGPVAVLQGRGARVLDPLLLGTLAAVHLVLPLSMAGAIAGERRAGTLDLLLVSGQSPARIVAQVYLARVWPALCLVLLALPLAAASYAAGGVSRAALPWLALGLAGAVLHVGAMGLMASAACETPFHAAVLTYVLLVPLADGPGPSMLGPARSLRGPTPLAWSLAIAALALVLAWARVRWPPRRESSAAQRSTRRRSASLPGEAPVAWRLTARGAIGEGLHLLAPSTLLLPVGVVCMIQLSTHGGGPSLVLGLLGVALWIGACVGVGLLAAYSLTAERTGGTLELLLTTPLAGARIVEQSLAPARRLGGGLWPLLLLTLLTRLWVELPPDVRTRGWAGVVLTGGLLTLQAVTWFAAGWVLLALGRWVGAAWSLTLRRPERAVAATGATLAGWVVLPLLAARLLRTDGLTLASPAGGLWWLETGGVEQVGWTLGHTALLGLIALALRRAVRGRADRWLGRPS